MTRQRKICNLCNGDRYPLQCRNSTAWRKAQEAPEECPHDLKLGYSPDGRKRGDYRVARDPERSRKVRCAYLVIQHQGGCCESDLYCTWDDTMREIGPDECQKCPVTSEQLDNSTTEQPVLTEGD